MPYTEDKRIPELAPNEILMSNGMLAWYSPADDKTYRINASSILAGLTDPGSVWNPDYSYPIDEIVSYGGSIWISNVNDNLGNPPGPMSLFWTLEPDPPPPGGSFTLVDGSGTTVNGTSNGLDLKGVLTVPAELSGADDSLYFLLSFQDSLAEKFTTLGVAPDIISMFSQYVTNAFSTGLTMNPSGEVTTIAASDINTNHSISFVGAGNISGYPTGINSRSESMTGSNRGLIEQDYNRVSLKVYDDGDMPFKAITVTANDISIEQITEDNTVTRILALTNTDVLKWIDAADLGGGGSITDGSGTTVSGSAVDLGGTLNSNAEIVGSFDFSVGLLSNQINDFNANVSGVIRFDSNNEVFITGAGNIQLDTDAALTLYALSGIVDLQTPSFQVTSNSIVLVNTPNNNNSLTEILGRNSGTGELEYIDYSAFGGGSLVDGQGTTANGSAVDLGGLFNTAILIDGRDSSDLGQELKIVNGLDSGSQRGLWVDYNHTRLGDFNGSSDPYVDINGTRARVSGGNSHLDIEDSGYVNFSNVLNYDPSNSNALTLGMGSSNVFINDSFFYLSASSIELTFDAPLAVTNNAGVIPTTGLEPAPSQKLPINVNGVMYEIFLVLA